MAEQKIKEIVGRTFLEIAEGLQTGDFNKKYTIAIVADGSEHGDDNLKEAAGLAESKGIKTIVLNGDGAHDKMEALLESGEVDGAVAMHYPFPIGVSTVGKVMTPAKGRAMYIATTTGTSDTDRTASMIRNAVYGIAAAKADGIKEPSVGIVNIDGARQCEKALIRLRERGYNINFADSCRADGGMVMRGNDLLRGSADVMVMDSLTGNMMIKIFSSYTTGGSYETIGWGYGPGIGEGFDKTILIISRASGAPLIAGAVEMAANLIKNNMNEVVESEIKRAKAAGLEEIIKEFSKPAANKTKTEAKTPPKEVVTEQITGIEVMDLDEAVSILWCESIYAESGMGCTGPIIRISQSNKDRAIKILTEKNYI